MALQQMVTLVVMLVVMAIQALMEGTTLGAVQVAVVDLTVAMAH
jgi:hypothetical protein